MGCEKAQGFLELHDWQTAELTDARKVRQGPEEALALARSVRRVIVGKGKKFVMLDMKSDPPDDTTLLALLLGPSGNLRAPTIRKGDTLLVGFNEEAYKKVLDG